MKSSKIVFGALSAALSLTSTVSAGVCAKEASVTEAQSTVTSGDLKAEAEKIVKNAEANLNKVEKEAADTMRPYETEIQKLETDLNTKKSEIGTLEDKLQQVADARAKAQSSEALTKASAAVKQMQNAVSSLSASTSYTTPAKLEAATQRAADAKAQIDKGAIGFYESLGDNADAKLAVNILNGSQTPDNGESKIIQVKPAENTDAASLENMKQAIENLNLVNEYRARENASRGYKEEDEKYLDPLQVSSSLMAISQYQLDYSRNIVAHLGAFNVGENVAWNYQNPFDGWYDEEKRLFDEGKTDQAGHYENIVSTSYTAMGYSYAQKTDPNFRYSFAYGQTFASADSSYTQHSYTVDEYQELFDEYYAKVKTEAEEADRALASEKSKPVVTEQAAADVENAMNIQVPALREKLNTLMASIDNAIMNYNEKYNTAVKYETGEINEAPFQTEAAMADEPTIDFTDANNAATELISALSGHNELINIQALVESHSELTDASKQHYNDIDQPLKDYVNICKNIQPAQVKTDLASKQTDFNKTQSKYDAKVQEFAPVKAEQEKKKEAAREAYHKARTVQDSVNKGNYETVPNDDTYKQFNSLVTAYNKAHNRPTVTTPVKTSKVEMYRLYNPNSGEHFYTQEKAERNHLTAVGWKSEGTGWTAPKTSNTPVYRLYNPNAGDHHYTMSLAERNYLTSVGWDYEGIGWYSDDKKAVPLYRQYNPNAKAGSHNYTTSQSEHSYLVSLGWNDEGIAWYGVK